MKCSVCGQKEANVKIVSIINGEKTETNLCEDCAKAHNHLNFQQGFNLSNLISDFFNSDFPLSQINNSKEIKCEKCNSTWQDFKTKSRLGCSSCYETFREQLIPIVRRVHGNVEHLGQTPKTIEPNLKIKKQLKQLKISLQESILEERYEDAAKFRDQIKSLEKKLEEKSNE